MKRIHLTCHWTYQVRKSNEHGAPTETRWMFLFLHFSFLQFFTILPPSFLRHTTSQTKSATQTSFQTLTLWPCPSARTTQRKTTTTTTGFTESCFSPPRREAAPPGGRHHHLIATHREQIWQLSAEGDSSPGDCVH